MSQVKNMDVSELENYIFIHNTHDNQLLININCLKKQKELFFLLFDLFCKGLILMYGENNRMTLNTLGMEQFDEVKRKLKCAHIHLNLILYDKEMAELLDLIPKDMDDHYERNIITHSLGKIRSADENMDLKEYVFNLFMNETLYCINFDILH